MKTKYNISLLFAGFIVLASLNAKNTITKSLNCFRSGDNIEKQQVEFKDPGRKGENIVWDFSQLKAVNENYKVRYFKPVKADSDTLFINCLEHKTLYKFAILGDSIFMSGFENSGSRLSIVKPELFLSYPFTYGDSIESVSEGSGSYLNALLSNSKGRTYTVADAAGTLILPDGDTLKDVLRTRSEHIYVQKTIPFIYRNEMILAISDAVRNDTLENEVIKNGSGNDSVNSNSDNRAARRQMIRWKTDSIYYHTETCRWYAPGYRYPLFETICNYGKALPEDSCEKKDISTAFYFPPSKHDYLVDDPKNKAIIDSMAVARDTIVNEADTLLFDYNFYPNPVRSVLYLELLLDVPSSVVFHVFDTSGNLVAFSDEKTQSAGMHYFSISLSNLRTGEFVLHITVGEQTASSILIKI
jgi:hypothetical protein